MGISQIEKATLLKNRIELRMIGNAHRLPLTVRTLLSSMQQHVGYRVCDSL